MNCPRCEKETSVYAELADGGTVDHCGECHAVIPRGKPVAAVVPNAEPPRLAAVAAPRAEPSGIAKIVAEAKARLAELERHIAEFESMVAEAEALRAMIRAAEQRPAAKAA